MATETNNIYKKRLNIREQYKLCERLRGLGEVKPTKDSPETWIYHDGWSDKRVAEELGYPGDQVSKMRRLVFGRLPRGGGFYPRKNGKTGMSNVSRLQFVEQKLSEHRDWISDLAETSKQTIVAHENDMANIREALNSQRQTLARILQRLDGTAPNYQSPSKPTRQEEDRSTTGSPPEAQTKVTHYI